MAGTPPPNAVCEAGDLTCSLNGVRKLSGLSQKPGAATIKLTVKGSPLVPVASAKGDAEYTGCTYSDNSGSHPCNSTAVATSGAGKLTVGGKNVLLDSDTVNAVNPVAGPAKATVHPGQTKLTAS